MKINKSIQEIKTGRTYNFEQVLKCQIIGSYICPVFNDETYIYFLKDESRHMSHYYIASDFDFDYQGNLIPGNVIRKYDEYHDVDYSNNDNINTIVMAHMRRSIEA